VTRRAVGLAGLCLAVALPAACARHGVLRLTTDTMELSVDAGGRVERIVERSSGRDIVPDGRTSPLLQLRIGGRYVLPESAEQGLESGDLILTFEDGRQVVVATSAAPTHLRFEIRSVSDLTGVELAVWGPYATELDESIGETVGVAIGSGFAVGLQALNPKTLGGFPWNENDAMPQLDIFEGDPTDLSEEGKRAVLYRVEAAKPDEAGSTLQAYVRERATDRVVENWRHPGYLVPAFDDGGLVGSAIALFGVPSDRALETIGAIEVAEGLPHPTIEGEWAKTFRGASAAYVILPFSEATFDRALDVVERAGLRYLYHPGPFASWGHFPLREADFPNGVEGLARLVERAEARGIHVGLHTLSNFITPTDPYVTPVPDPRLAVVGTARLTGALAASARAIPVDAPDLFEDVSRTTLQAVRIGDEIIRYRAVSNAEPWTLVDAERGAFGTTAGAHAAGETVALLADHAYKVFLGDASLSMEMARRLADLYNRAGLRQISFDGLEGNRSTGMGNYGEILFATAWFDALSDDIRSHYIADASRTSHYFWHVYSRMNWGEPWYAGFRESQTEYRMKNQAYFRRNFMPGMLGWFSMRAGTSREDIEWMLARSAAYDAGYAFYTSFEALEANGQTDEILVLLGLWERARMTGAFSADQKARMEDVSREFRLDERGDGTLALVPVSVFRLEHADRERQPGEPTETTLAFENPGAGQPLSFILTADGGAVDRIVLSLDGRLARLDIRLEDGQHLVYRGGDTMEIATSSWSTVRRVPTDASAWTVPAGPGRLDLDARVTGDQDARARLEVRLDGLAEPVGGGGR